MRRELALRGRPARMLGPVLVLALVAGGVQLHRSRDVAMPLLSEAVVIRPDGRREMVPPGRVVELLPGTRVLRSADPRSERLAQEQRRWLAAGTVPGAGGPDADLARSALLDLHTLLLDDGALVGAWPSPWRYVWPRDAAFAAVALAGTGHAGDARRILAFLQERQPPDGAFQARYRPDAPGVPDDRGVQSDGAGWVLWATQRVIDGLPAAQRPAALAELGPLVERSTEAVLALAAGPGALPPPSQDYWEMHDDRLSLGTVAPLALGLRSAAGLQAELGDAARSALVSSRERVLAATVRARFGVDGYPRYLGDDRPDASVAFLLPPFAPAAGPDVVAAWRRAAVAMARPAGGLAPGAGWRADGVSWTPPTALFAWTAAELGDIAGARARLGWLAAHRTRYGALPEKVLADGRPAGPAPLVWTSAMTVLAVAALDRPSR